MLIESVGSSVIVGKLRKGKFANFKDAQLEKWYLIVAAFVLEFFTVAMAYRGIRFFIDNILYIHLACYLLLFLGLYFNRHQLAFKIVFIGVLLNFIVIMANGGQMPVSADAMINGGLVENLNSIKTGKIITHTVIDGDTRLSILSDVMVLPKPYPRPKVFSIGDVFLAVGVFIYIQQIMVKKNQKGQNKQNAASI